MSKSAHDFDCAARENLKCDCLQGSLRKAKKKALTFFKRHKGKVQVIESEVEKFNWLDRKLGRE